MHALVHVCVGMCVWLWLWLSAECQLAPVLALQMHDGTVQQRPGDKSQRLFISQNLSDMAWAFAVLKHQDTQLFEMLATRCVLQQEVCTAAL